MIDRHSYVDEQIRRIGFDPGSWSYGVAWFMHPDGSITVYEPPKAPTTRYSIRSLFATATAARSLRGKPDYTRHNTRYGK